jgi:hypothetical protein
MNHAGRTSRVPWLVVALATAGLAAGCDDAADEWPDMGTRPDYGHDYAEPEDAATEVEPACEYPPGPYGFRAVGNTVADMSWPSALAGADETLAADLEAIRCDPSVRSIFIQVATLACPNCPTRVREIAGLKAHWETYGAKWVFVIADAPSVAQANDYVERYGTTFGWRTNDADNSAGPGAVAGSSIFGGVPWTGVIRASDMRLMYDESDTSYLDIRAIAEDLAGG